MADDNQDVERDMWTGCGCEDCRRLGAILSKVEPALREVEDELARSEFNMVSGTINQLIEVMAMMSSVHVSGVMQVADALYSVSSYVMERAREFQMRGVVRTEVQNALKSMMVPIGSVAVEPGCPMPPGAPAPGRLFSVGGEDDEDGGKGGSNLH
jgi:hypothetical protein